MQGGRDLRVFHGKRGLDQTRDPRSDLHVADVGFHRTHRTVLGAIGVITEGTGKRINLDRVAQRRARAVAFDVGDRFGMHAGAADGIPHHAVFTLGAGRGVAGFVAEPRTTA